LRTYKRLLIVCAISVVILALWFAFPPSENRGFSNQALLSKNAAHFPNSLRYIGEEAFQGTAFRTLVLQDGFLQAGERAFSEMSQLRDAYIPGSVEYIAGSAFMRSGLETIYGLYDTYAEKWAEEHQVAFALTDKLTTMPVGSWYSIVAIVGLHGLLCPCLDDNSQKIKRYLNRIIISMRPQDRPELNPIDYRFP